MSKRGIRPFSHGISIRVYYLMDDPHIRLKANVMLNVNSAVHVHLTVEKEQTEIFLIISN